MNVLKRPAKNPSVIDDLNLEVERPNYSKLTNDELYDLMYERDIIIPRDDKGVMIRKHAVHALMKWDDLNAHVYNLDPRVRVTLHHPGGNAPEYAFTSVNGKRYQVPFGQEVQLPASIVRSLDDAVEVQYKWKEDKINNRMVPEITYKRTHNYTLHGVVEEDMPKKASAKKSK